MRFLINLQLIAIFNRTTCFTNNEMYVYCVNSNILKFRGKLNVFTKAKMQTYMQTDRLTNRRLQYFSIVLESHKKRELQSPRLQSPFNHQNSQLRLLKKYCYF